MPRTGRPAKAPKIERTCEVCSAKWSSYAWDVNKQRFCSRACWAKSKISALNARRAEPRFNECRWCKTSFRVGGAGHPHYGARYCCKSCASHARMADGVEAHTPPREMSREERAWLAALIDGEGSLVWTNPKHLHMVRIDIANTHIGILEHAKAVSGTGKIYIRGAPKKAHHNQVYYWSCSGQNARALLYQLLPWLIIKKLGAEVALGIVKATEPPKPLRSLANMRAAAASSDEAA